MKYSAVMVSTVLLVTTLLAGQSAQADPVLLGPADLDPIIDALPATLVTDPLDLLRSRLDQLEQLAQACPEREGLALAISLIHIARQNRLVPKASLVERPAVAGL